jgi:hypothetical protein
MEIMNTVEKRDFIHSHLHRVKDPVINDIYDKMLSFLHESMINESEEDIKNGDLISHESLKDEVIAWRCTK